MKNATPTAPASGDAQDEDKVRPRAARATQRTMILLFQDKDDEGQENKGKSANTAAASKKKKKEIDLPISARVPSASKNELERLIEQEVSDLRDVTVRLTVELLFSSTCSRKTRRRRNGRTRRTPWKSTSTTCAARSTVAPTRNSPTRRSDRSCSTIFSPPKIGSTTTAWIRKRTSTSIA